VTARKDEIKLDRTPHYVSRETGAAELEISPETWDRWVASGRLPPPAPGFPATTPRWRWEDIDSKMSGKGGDGADDPYVAAVRKLGQRGEHGAKKDSRHDAA
jgi:hypothetical protein